MSKAIITPHMLDSFVAPKLSQLSRCKIQDLPIQTRKRWLRPFVLQHFRLPDPIRTHRFNFLRRTEAAVDAYGNARAALVEYAKAAVSPISPVFTAVLEFEICLGQIWEGFLFISQDTDLPRLLERGGGRTLEKVGKLVNANRHAQDRIQKGVLPEKTSAAMWLTNQGLESHYVGIGFDELRALLVDMARLADNIVE